jgi:plasmid stabilization system protein ParE
MNRTLRIVERARADVDHIFEWLVGRSARGAVSWYMVFRHAVDKIAASPESFSLAPETGLLGRAFRQTLFKTRRGRTYRVIFEVTDAAIIILRVRGPGQSPLRRRDLA